MRNRFDLAIRERHGHKHCCFAIPPRCKGQRSRLHGTLTIGRQFFYPNPRALAQMFRWQGIERDAGDILRESGGWAEAFFHLLGARSVASLDASPFEGASLIQDLNLPIDESLKERFSVVFDGGTLEHIFNVPQALRNCMEMLREGDLPFNTARRTTLWDMVSTNSAQNSSIKSSRSRMGSRLSLYLLQESVRGGRWSHRRQSRRSWEKRCR